MRGQGVDHPGAEDMGHIAHHGVQPPAIDEGLQLVLYIVRLLTRESGHGIRPYEAARRQPMTSFTIAGLGFKFFRWNGFGLRRAASLAVFGVDPGAEDNGEQSSRRESLDNLHDLPPKTLAQVSEGAPLPARWDRTTRPTANAASVYGGRHRIGGPSRHRRTPPPNVVAHVCASFDCAAGTSASVYFVATMFQSPSDARFSVTQTHFELSFALERCQQSPKASCKAQSPCAPPSWRSEKDARLTNEGGRRGKKRSLSSSSACAANVVQRPSARREPYKVGGNVHGWRADSGRLKKEEAGRQGR